MSLAGMALILAIAFLLSSNRRAIRLRVVAAAFALQALIAWLVLWTPWGRRAIQGMAGGVANLLGYANKGTEFLFGPSATNPLANTFALFPETPAFAGVPSSRGSFGCFRPETTAITLLSLLGLPRPIPSGMAGRAS